MMESGLFSVAEDGSLYLNAQFM